MRCKLCQVEMKPVLSGQHEDCPPPWIVGYAHPEKVDCPRAGNFFGVEYIKWMKHSKVPKPRKPEQLSLL